MKAMCIDENKNFVWTDVADPVCHGEFDVKLKVEACAVNRADLMQRAGIYAPPEGWPLWPGLECAGEVLECPANGRFKPGDKVCALLGGGKWSEGVASITFRLEFGWSISDNLSTFLFVEQYDVVGDAQRSANGNSSYRCAHNDWTHYGVGLKMRL